ncbi:modulator of FtsH protease HflC [mine drainage metagenome]|uniref:Modulator of FtsH protease HflC n=1 Tax=mine drainage metagenome TaxID=410659 RepID=A0A1J5RGZ3_9ZZZZ
MNKTVRLILAGLVIVALWLADQTFYVLTEGQQALVVRLGRPVGIETHPGLKEKMPLVDTVLFYDSRLLPLHPGPEQVILGDQKRLEVQTYTRFRISDPLKFYQAVRTLTQAQIQLAQLVSSSLRRELGQVPLPVLLSTARTAVVNNIQAEVILKARALGVEVAEVRIHRADLPYETSQAIYDRMKSEREREAKELRAQGSEWAQGIEAKADRDRTVILSEAERQATIIKGDADAQASRIYAEAFGKDPGFYRFYRSLQTYQQSLAGAAPMLVLSPDAEFLRDLKSGPAGKGGK